MPKVYSSWQYNRDDRGSDRPAIPDRVQLQVDIRALPGWDVTDVPAMVDEAIVDLADSVEVAFRHADPSTASPIDIPLWDALQRVSEGFYPGAKNIPFLT